MEVPRTWRFSGPNWQNPKKNTKPINEPKLGPIHRRAFVRPQKISFFTRWLTRRSVWRDGDMRMQGESQKKVSWQAKPNYKPVPKKALTGACLNNRRKTDKPDGA
jgi:hypothetical protein